MKVGGWRDPGTMQTHYSHAGREAQEAVSVDLDGMVEWRLMANP